MGKNNKEKPLNGQPFAAFGPSSPDHPDTAFGLHPRPETMGSGPLDSAGLIRSFHVSSIPMRAKGSKILFDEEQTSI